ncbi:hypothetical protein EDD11_007929 [Mortierella claussenii]|nr:hypothetical protein EDD11_007929 [Mortierella claussenii]
MTNALANTNSEIQEIVSPVPSIAFAQESDRRGRDISVTPLIEEDTVPDTLPETKNKKGHRNSLAAFAERLRSRSRSQSRRRSASDDDLSLDRTSTKASATSVQSTSSRKSSKSRSGSRSGRSSLDGGEGPYADVVRAQNEFMEKLRAEQEKNHVTHNADGIPIPPRPSPGSRSSSRRSSVTHILGLDKPLLSF